jgi:hypothetical protein
MGLLTWLFPSPESRLQAAKKLLDSGRFADARLEALDIDIEGAAEVVSAAENALALKNLHVAVGLCRTGQDRGVAEHLELADKFHHGGLEEEFREARREMRELRRDRREADESAKREAEARLLSVDPLGLQGGPSLLDTQVPTDLYDADDDEVQARLGLLVEAYPPAIRDTLAELGPEFSRAVLDLEDGRADLALDGLLQLPDTSPPVLFERTRACHLLGDSAAGARWLRAFSELVGGHHQIGRHHTGVYLAQLLAESGDPRQALQVLRSVRTDEPAVGGGLFAQLLVATGALDEAEQVTVTLLRGASKDAGLYMLLAEIRERTGRRVEAMAALERYLQATDCPPGRCGYKPPNFQIMARLATMYLEDGIEPERAMELADQVLAAVEKPTFPALYLNALVGRANHAEGVENLVNNLYEATEPGSPARRKLEQNLPI